MIKGHIDDQLINQHEKYVIRDISHNPKEEILSFFPNTSSVYLQYWFGQN